MSDVNRIVNQLSRQVSTWLRDSSEGASDWWDTKNSVQKRFSMIRGLIAQRREITGGIGAKVYTLHRKGKVRNSDLLADCQKLDDIGDRIEQLKLEIEELRDKERGITAEDVELSDESPVVDEEDVDTRVAVAVEVEVVDADTEVDAEDEETDPEGGVSPGDGADEEDSEE